MKRIARRVGFVLLASGTLVSVLWVVLALIDSPRAPRSAVVVAMPALAQMLGALLVLLTSIGLGQPLVWQTATEVPEHLIATPRTVASTGRARRRVIAAAAVFASVTLGAPAAFYPYFRQWSALRNRGVETTGVATRRVLVRNPEAHYLYYRYSAGGRPMESRDDVEAIDFKLVAEGQEVPVTYLASRPHVALARRRADLTFASLAAKYWHLLALIASAALLVPVLFAVSRAAEARLLRIARDGRAVLARVVDANRSAVFYEFDGGSGLTFIARRKMSGTPRVGDGIVVLLDRGEPPQALALITLMDEIRIEGAGANTRALM